MKPRSRIAASILIGVALVSRASDVGKVMTLDDYRSLPSVKADHRIQYGPDRSQFGDLWLPAGGGPHPLVIAIHGGCWQSDFSLEPLSSFAASLRDDGIAVWSIEFRRVGDPGGGWPGTFLDVARAADYARTLAQDFAIDLGRVIAVGHSSGGHLAAWLGGRRGIDAHSVLFQADPLKLDAVVSLAAVLDMADAVEGPLRAGDDACLQANIDVMGGRPHDVPSHYRSGSPIELIPTGVPSRILVGARDNPHRIAQLRRYATSAIAAGDDVELIELPHAGHFDVINPKSPDWRTIRDTICRSVGAPTCMGPT